MASRQNRSEVALCINLVHELQELIIGSRRAFISGNACVVDRQSMLDKLNELEHSLPEAVRQAHESLKILDAHQEQVEEECRVKVNEANQKAQQILASAKKTEEEAQQKAASVASAAAAAAAENQRKSEEEAKSCVEAGRAEAMRIVEEAQRHAAALVSKEEIVRRARVEVKEMQENAQAQLANVRRNTFDYLDNLMAQADQAMAGLINDLRMERNELNAQR